MKGTKRDVLDGRTSSTNRAFASDRTIKISASIATTFWIRTAEQRCRYGRPVPPKNCDRQHNFCTAGYCDFNLFESACRSRPHAVSDLEKLAAYALKLPLPTVLPFGGGLLARDLSLEKAAALTVRHTRKPSALSDGAVRDFRIVEGAEYGHFSIVMNCKRCTFHLVSSFHAATLPIQTTDAE